MTTKSFDLPLIIPRGADCGGCVDELRAGIDGLQGVHEVSADPMAGLIHVHFDPAVVTIDELTREARRVGAETHCAEHCPLGDHDHHGDLAFVLPDEHGLDRRLAHITGLDCADCALKLEKALQHSDGVIDASVSFGAATLKVSYDPAVTTFDSVLDRVHKLGYDSLERQRGEAPSDGGGTAVAANPWVEPRGLTTIFSGVAVVAGFAAEAVQPVAAPYLFAVAMMLGGAFVARAAVYALRARTVDMNVLMTVAALGAAAIGEWSEAGLVMFLFALGNQLQALTVERTRRAVKSLATLSPASASVLRDGNEVVVAVADVRPGDVVVVRPGERVPVDGTVVGGLASVDQSAITGESLPLARHADDDVFAGSIVQGGSLEVRATTGADDTTIARVIHLVEEAQAERAPLQSTVDRFAARYTPVVVALAAAVVLIPTLVFSQPFDTWLYRGLALLIIACPCALVISTPVSILAALGAATRRGVLIKGGVYLEEARRLRAVAFDKTGTLTVGEPVVTDVVALADEPRERVLAHAAACERLSEHPLARAIVAAADAGAEASPAATVSRFHTIAGAGVRADLDGVTHLVGKPDLMPADAVARATVTRLEGQGRTVVAFGTADRLIGLIAVADTLRPGARQALDALRAQGVERLAMLTGDNEVTAAAIGDSAGVDEVRAGLLPQDKVDAVLELREGYGSVAMVGDGVNDAPALAASSLGIAMGAAGTDAALETADIALMGDDLSAIADVVALSRRTTTVIWENIVFSIAVKGVFLVLAPLGLVSLWMAVFADVGTSLLVIANGLRLRHASRRPTLGA